MFGYLIPRNYMEAMESDFENKNSKWYDKLEMESVLEYKVFKKWDKAIVDKHKKVKNPLVEFWGLPPLFLFFNVSIGWVLRFALSTECYRTRKLGYINLNWPRCSAQVTESLALTDGSFCQKQTLYILDM